MEKIDARKLPPEALEHIRRQAFVTCPDSSDHELRETNGLVVVA